MERLWGTAQDRLITELRLAGAGTIDEANAVLADYVPRHNARFAVPPASVESSWRPLPAGRPAEAVFCFRHPRSVARDGTFTLGGRELMIAGRSMASWKGRVLEVQERLDVSLWVELDGAFQSAVPAPERPGHPALPRADPRALRPAARSSLAPLSCGETTVPKSLTG